LAPECQLQITQKKSRKIFTGQAQEEEGVETLNSASDFVFLKKVFFNHFEFVQIHFFTFSFETVPGFDSEWKEGMI
jgi:hypothetical protein